MDEKGLTGPMIERAAHEAGHKLPPSTFNSLKGPYPNPNADTLRALAAGLGVPIEEVLAATFDVTLDVGQVDPVFIRLTLKYKHMNDRDRRLCRTIIDNLAEELGGAAKSKVPAKKRA
jgi:hypothetical protein